MVVKYRPEFLQRNFPKHCFGSIGQVMEKLLTFLFSLLSFFLIPDLGIDKFYIHVLEDINEVIFLHAEVIKFESSVDHIELELFLDVESV